MFVLLLCRFVGFMFVSSCSGVVSVAVVLLCCVVVLIWCWFVVCVLVCVIT